MNQSELFLISHLLHTNTIPKTHHHTQSMAGAEGQESTIKLKIEQLEQQLDRERDSQRKIAEILAKEEVCVSVTNVY